MTEALGRIELPLDGPRGPDVLCEVVVPGPWLASGERIQIDLPGRLTCAACSGGGCDACGRSGALELPPREGPLELTLPTQLEPAALVRVRIPGCGGASPDAALGRGQLILSVRAGDEPSRGVRRCVSAAIKPTRVDPRSAARMVVFLALVALLFVYLLRFSGWL